MTRIAVNGIDLNVETSGRGDGPALLLLHGFTGDAATWQPVLPYFDAYRTVRVDLIGHGQSDSPADPARYTMAHAVEDLMALLDHLDIEQTALVGYSLGGRVALHFALAAPELLWALVLESASPGIDDPMERDARFASDAQLAASLERDGIEAFVDRWQAQPLFASQLKLPAAVLEDAAPSAPGELDDGAGELAARHGGRRAGRPPSPAARDYCANAVPRRRAGQALCRARTAHGRRGSGGRAPRHRRRRPHNAPGAAGRLREPRNRLPRPPRAKRLRKAPPMADVTTTIKPAASWQEDSRDYEDSSTCTAEGIAKITINRPEVRNAFRPQTILELQDAFRRAHQDDTIGVVILTGAGDKAFCSGGDQKVRGDGGYVGDDGVPRLNVLELQRQIRTLPKPVIAMVAGYAIGGGHVLHIVCDLTIAADNAVFGQTGPRVGSFDAGYGATLLARIVGHKKAREIWYLCRQYDAQQALDMGLVNTVVPLARLEEETVAWCREMLAMSPTALRFLKASFNADTDGLAGIQQLAGDATLLYYLTEEAKEGRNAFIREAQARLQQVPALPVKVTRIRWAPYRIPFRAPYETAHGAATHRTGVIVRLDSDSGHVGLGEASLDPSITEGAVEALLPQIEAPASALVGADPADVDGILDPYLAGDDAARAAHCAIETALADAGARAAGQPLAHLIGQPSETGAASSRATVAVNATVASHSLEAAAAAALVARVAGFGCVKLKVGMETTVAAEVARVAAVREVIGGDIKLRLDANGAWDEATAIVAIRALEAFDIELIEQPVSADDLAALGRIRRAVTTAIAADEALSDYASAERAIAHADVVVLKPMRLGGISTASYVARYAAASGLDAIVTTTIDTGIATAMALHLAATLPDHGRAHGLATASLLESDLLVRPLAIERGYMKLPLDAGLGVELDEMALARYTSDWREVSA